MRLMFDGTWVQLLRFSSVMGAGHLVAEPSKRRASPRDENRTGRMKQRRPKTQGKRKSAAKALARAGASLISIVQKHMLNRATTDQGTSSAPEPEGEVDGFKAASAIISKTLDGIEDLPVLPREAEDILTILARERHKWLKDGRLRSVGTRTVKMRGRSKSVTFHVFDPRHIEDVLDRDLPTVWREQDAQEVAENRRRGARKAALTRAGKGKGAKTPGKQEGPPSKLEDGTRSRTRACCARLGRNLVLDDTCAAIGCETIGARGFAGSASRTKSGATSTGRRDR
jgi:hypothetical protein